MSLSGGAEGWLCVGRAGSHRSRHAGRTVEGRTGVFLSGGVEEWQGRNLGSGK